MRVKGQTVSCIIPAYNEANNIAKVLEVIKDFPYFEEIIIVDDGSKDNTVSIAESFAKNNPRFNIIKNEINRGKTAVINQAINKAQGQIIVMLDSDLIDLTTNNIIQLIKPIVNNKYSLTILDRAGDRKPIWGWTNCARFFGGERAFWKKDFLEIDLEENDGYLLETKMNFYYINNKKKIKTIYCDNLYTVHQYDKITFWQGTKSYLKMSSQIIKSATPQGFLTMMLNIEEDRINSFYKMYHKTFLFAPFVLLAGFIFSIGTYIYLNIKEYLIIPNKLLELYKNALENINKMIKF
jgi:polyisoprenyl-phosphate glycosyltransferase